MWYYTGMTTVKAKITSRYHNFKGKAVRNIYLTLKDDVTLTNGDTLVLNPLNLSQFILERKKPISPVYPYPNG